jgi:hypothetical protein
MTDPRVLRPCEVTGQREVGGPMQRCDRPGRLVRSPSGKTYAMCEEHFGIFARNVWDIARNDGTGCDIPGCDHKRSNRGYDMQQSS